MNERRLQEYVAYSLILAPVLAMAVILYYWLIEAIEFNEARTTALTILPIFAIYITTITNFIISTRKPITTDTSDHVTRSYAIFIGSITLAFICFMPIMISFAASGGVIFDNFILALSIVETVLGIYMGFVIHSLYEHNNL